MLSTKQPWIENSHCITILRLFGRESCYFLTDYLSKYKTICNELAAIKKPLSDDHNSFWVLNGLGLNYQMTLRPPLLKYYELLSLLHSYESRILIEEVTNSLPQFPFVAMKSTKAKQTSPMFTLINRGIAPTTSSSSLAIELSAKLILNNTKPIISFVRIDDELQEAMKKFKLFVNYAGNWPLCLQVLQEVQQEFQTSSTSCRK